MRRRLVDCAAALLHSAGALRRLHGRWLPGAVSVVTYHGLLRDALPVDDPCFLAVERFAAQMEYLARHFHVLHVEDAFAAHGPGGGRPLACVTFDDGFASVHDLALPVLERLSLPATVFVVTGLIDSADTVWSARLHQAVCQSRAARVTLGGETWALGGAAARAAASERLQRALKVLPAGAFCRSLEEVLDQLRGPGAGAAETWEPFRILSAEQVRRMGRQGLVRFGAHSASHQILTRTTREDACRQIHASLSAIEALVGLPSRVFAYPNGGAEDFDDAVVDVLRRAGVEYAVTMIPGPNDRTTDPHRLRRYGIGSDGSVSRFAWRVHHAAVTIPRIVRAGRPAAGGA